MHALRWAEPIDLDAELGERLLEHPVSPQWGEAVRKAGGGNFAGRAFDEDRAIGNPAGEDRQFWRLIRRNPSCIVEVVQQRVRLLYIELECHSSLS
jgi:hypothetical protein